MKVLYIGHYREGSGWSQAAIDYMLALDSVGVEVVARPIKLNSSVNQLPDKILEMEDKDASGADYCIQHVLPHFMSWREGFKKIVGFAITETSSFKTTSWPSHLNLMDEVWTPCKDGMTACNNSGVRTPVKVVPHATNINKFNGDYPTLDFDNKFVFYFIGEHIARKRISALIRAYYGEFDSSDNVLLVIKTHKSGMSQSQLDQSLSESATSIKNKVRRFNDDFMYPEIAFITDRLTDEQILGLHKSGNCFVNASYGDAWNMPCFDSMLAGNFVISSNVGGMKDYLGGVGKLVGGSMEPCFGADAFLSDLHTGNEEWFSVSISEFQKMMRIVYKQCTEIHTSKFNHNKVYVDYVKTESINRAKKYSYENIGRKMKELLNA